MKVFYHICVFLALHLPLWIIITCLSEAIHCTLFFQGLLILSAVSVLNTWEALFCLWFVGFFEDALGPLDCLFGATAFCFTVTMLAFKTVSWKNTFRYHSRFWGCLLTGLLVAEIVIVKSWYVGEWWCSLKFYCLPAIFSMLIVGWIAPYWMKLLKKYFI